MSVKTPKQAKSADFYSNRKFSKEVREMLAAGKLEDARARCAAQTDEAMARLASDDEYRADYVRCVCTSELLQSIEKRQHNNARKCMLALCLLTAPSM